MLLSLHFLKKYNIENFLSEKWNKQIKKNKKMLGIL